MSRSRIGETATIALSGTESTAINVSQEDLVGLLMPAAFTGTSVTFTTSRTSDGTFSPVYDNAGALVSVTVGTSRVVTIPPDSSVAFLNYVKIISGSTETGERSIITIVRNITTP